MSPSRQIFRGENQTFDAPAVFKRSHNCRDVRFRHPAVEKMIGLDQNGHTRGALIEAARCANARPQLRETALLELFFQGPMDRLRAPRDTRSLFVFVGAAIGADKEISLSLRHTCTLVAPTGAVNDRPKKAWTRVAFSERWITRPAAPRSD